MIPSGLPDPLLTLAEFCNRLELLCLKSGVVGLPRDGRDRNLLLRSVLLVLDSRATYDQKQLDVALQGWLEVVGPRIETDHVTLRRHLVDHGFLERDGYGREYRIAPLERHPVRVEEAVARLDLAQFLDQRRQSIAERKAQHQS